jgi:hypothetical protein
MLPSFARATIPEIVCFTITQVQYSAFREIPVREAATQAVSASSVELDAWHWHGAKAGLMSTAERFLPEKQSMDMHR